MSEKATFTIGELAARAGVTPDALRYYEPFGIIGSALAASACCIGPVAFSLLGAGALGASAVQLGP